MILGVDFDTRSVHCVLLDDDTNEARYIPVPFVEHKPPFRFDDTREIPRTFGAWFRGYQDARDSMGLVGIHLVGIERPYSQSRGTAFTYGLIVGAILATIPRAVPVLDMPPNDRDFGWKALSVGKTNASKDDVHEWGVLELQAHGVWDEQHRTWPQDAWDALAIAHAARRLNERSAAAA